MNFNRVFLTGDTHGDLSRFGVFTTNNKTTVGDLMIILGDAGLNYYLTKKDEKNKAKAASEYPMTFLCIHGNHEERPENIFTYELVDFAGGKAYRESKYPNIYFAKDGEVYDINGSKCLVLGGAYSVDKHYRLANGYNWFASEQIPDSQKAVIEGQIDNISWSVDYVFSHTCPYYTRPVHMFMTGIDNSTVDTSMEVWLQKIADKLSFKRWYFGHFHDEWDNGKYTMLYKEIIPLGTAVEDD